MRRAETGATRQLPAAAAALAALAALATGSAWWTSRHPAGEAGRAPLVEAPRGEREARSLVAPAAHGRELPARALEVPPAPAASARPAPPDAPPPTGVLRVTVRSSDTGQVVAGQRVSAGDSAGFSEAEVERSRGVPGEGLLTDEHGQVEFTVSLDRSHEVFVWPHDGRRVPPLRTAGLLDVELEVPTVPDLVFIGRVVDAGSGLPVPDARVVLADWWLSNWICEGGASRRADATARLEPVELDAAGYFRVERGSWEDGHLEITAPGRAPVYEPLRPGFETRDSARLVELRHGAVLAIRVEDRFGVPSMESWVRAEADAALLSAPPASKAWGGGRVAWSAAASAGGYTLVDLPAEVELRVTLGPGNGAIPPTAVTLAPGEHRALVLRPGG